MLDQDIEKGFLKGSAWDNLYSPFKYKVEKISFSNDYQRAIYMLEVYTFTSIELTLYLSTHPNCQEAFETLKKVNAQKEKICEFIETKFSSLSSCSVLLNGFFDLDFPWSDKNVGV